MNPVIHRWTTPGLGSVNTYWIDADRGVIVIDGQRELSKATEVLREIEKTGKPIKAVFLTHPHPDHFGGIGVLAPPGSDIPLYGSKETHDSIQEDRFGLVKASRQVLGADFPAEVRLPDHFINDGDSLTIAGVSLTDHELGQGESECMTGIALPLSRAFFCADAIQHGMTAYLLEGRSQAWLHQLEQSRRVAGEAQILYPGHGEPGSLEKLITQQTLYLTQFREIVAAEIEGGRFDHSAPERVAAAMNGFFPGYLPVAAIADLLMKNAGPVANELRRARG